MDTFVRSNLDPEVGDLEHREYYRELLALRRTLLPGPVETIVDEEARFLRVRRGDVELLMNFSRRRARRRPAVVGSGPMTDGVARLAVPARCAVWDGRGTNFALFSENAESVELCLFDADDHETRIEVRERTALPLALLPAGRRARASGTGTGCTGPTTRVAGHRFNPTKLLIDPYAKAIDGTGGVRHRQRAALRARR